MDLEYYNFYTLPKSSINTAQKLRLHKFWVISKACSLSALPVETGMNLSNLNMTDN